MLDLINITVFVHAVDKFSSNNELCWKGRPKNFRTLLILAWNSCDLSEIMQV